MSKNLEFKKFNNEQEAFDLICAHLAQQKRRSRNDLSFCKYRSLEGGLKCAVGALIPDELYLPEMDGYHQTYKLSYTTSQLKKVPKLDEILERITGQFLSDIQTVHDQSFDLDSLKERLESCAKKHNLNPESIQLIKEWES